MAFNIDVPCKDDAAAVADTHLRAMESNTLLHAKFPDAECQTFLRESLQKDTLDHIADNQKRCILVARDPETGSIISFVKWLVQRQGVSQDDHAEEEQLPETCRSELFYSYLALTKDAREEVLGDKSYYHVTFLCTDPKWSGRGAASSLLRQVIEKAAKEEMPVILESTMPAVSFYQRLGFEIRKDLELMVHPKGSNEATERYAENVMVWTSKALRK